MSGVTNMLSKTKGLSKQPWIKVPYGTWAFLKKCGYTANEIGIVLFFYSKLSLNPVPDSTTVFATSQEIMEFASVTRITCYNALGKMYQRGLAKVATNTYDMKEFLVKMDVRGDLYLNQKQPSTEEET